MGNDRPKFYVDKAGIYGDVTVSLMGKKHPKTRRSESIVYILHKGFLILDADMGRSHLRFHSLGTWENREEAAERVEIINEALRQMEFFRGLFVTMRQGQWVMIVGGERVPFVDGLEIQMFNNELYTALPFVAKRDF